MEKKLNLNEVTSEVLEGTENAASCMDTKTKVIVATASVLTLGLAVGAFLLGRKIVKSIRAKKNAPVSESNEHAPEANENPNA